MSYSASPFAMLSTRPFLLPSKKRTSFNFGSLPGAVTIRSSTLVMVHTTGGLTSALERKDPSPYARYDFILFQFQFSVSVRVCSEFQCCLQHRSRIGCYP